MAETVEQWAARQPDLSNIESAMERKNALESWQKERPGYVNPMNYDTYEQYAGAANIRDEGSGSGQDLTNRANFYGMTTENYQNALSNDQTKPMGQFQQVYGNELLSPIEQIAAQTARAQGIGSMSPETAALAKANPDVFNAASQKFQNYMATTYPGTLEYENVLSGPMQFSSTGVKYPEIKDTVSMYIIDPRTKQYVKNPNYKAKTVGLFAEGGDVSATEAQMPKEADANPFADPNTMAVYDQMRQTVSPKEFGDEMLAGAAQVDPEAMAQFRNDLSQIDLSPEELDMLNNMVDEILANPERYAEVRAKYIEMGAPEELLPEQFDPQFFAAMNMAVDQLIAEPAGVQAFAMGGIAELKPIAKAIASYGRNGDTMLAHITPAEARMLRRRGGSGTINPATGLPEFFLKKAFKSLGKAIKSFASSTVGKIVTTVALGFFLGPAAAAAMGVGAGTAAGLAISGFVGGAGATLLGGGNLKDALKAGAIGGLTAGAVAGFSGAPLTGGTNLTAGQALSGQVDKFTNFLTPSASASGIQAPAIDAAGQTRGLAPTDVTQAPYKPLEMTGTPSKPFDSYFGSQPSTDVLRDNITTNTARGAYGAELARTNPEAFYNPNVAPPAPLPGQPGSDVLIGGKPAIPPTPLPGQPGSDVLIGGKPAIPPLDVTQAPYNPYDPATATRAVDFGYKPGGETSFMDKIKSGYNEYFSPSNIQAQGEPAAREAGISAQKAMLARTPNATPAMLDAEYLRASKAAMPGILATYGPITAAGIGALALGGGFKSTPAQPSAMRDQLMKPVTQRIAEGGNQRNYYIQGLPGVKYDQYGAPIAGQYEPMPMYDTGLGIASLPPRGYADGGEVTAVNFDEQAYLIANPDVAAEIAQGKFKNAYEHYVQYGKAEGRAAFNKTETAAAAAKTATETKAKQTAALGTVAAAKAAKKAKGFTSAYDNINAGLSFDAPEGYAASARATRQAAFAPTLNKFIAAGAANTATLGKTYAPTVVNQPYNNSTGYGNVFNPVATPVNYSTTPTVAGPGVYIPPAFVDNTAAIEAERRRIAEAERLRLAEAERLRLAEAERIRLAEAERLRLAEAERVRLAEAEARRLGQRRYSDQEIVNYLTTNPGQTDRQIAQAMFDFNVRPDQVMRATGTENLAGTNQSIDLRYDVARAPIVTAPPVVSAAEQARLGQRAYSDEEVKNWFLTNPGKTDRQIADAMFEFNVRPDQVIRATGTQNLAGTDQSIDLRYDRERAAALKETPTKLLNMGGIATLGTGGYPRKTGQINGPGTATSDSIPAMLSDGEFVMTAKAVRGAGKGDRRAGAKRMYALMNQLEKNAARG